jgi:hypothetical protein
MRGWFVVIPLLAGCPSEGDDVDHYEGLFCAFETLDLLAPRLQATNPFQTNERVYENQPQCWNLTRDINRTKHTSTGDITRIADEGPPLLGCALHGTGDEETLTFADGACVFPSEMGHYRLRMTTPAAFALLEPNQLSIEGTYEEERGDDLIAGTGRIFLSRPMTPLPMDHAYDARIPTDPNASCQLPACSTVALAGKGTLVSGDPQVCDELLASHADPFPLMLDGTTPIVLDETTCGATTWTGEPPYPYQRYHLDAATGTLTLDEVVLYQADALSDVCTLHWETTVTGC